jgi:SAM-dependent methyltransferase
VYRSTAHVYDLVYEAAGKDYARESAEIHAVVQRRRPGARSLLDVACGTGGHLRHLRTWYEVAGLDLEPAMLAAARAVTPGVTLVEGDMRAFALDKTFDAVVCLFSSVGYLRDDEELDAALSAMERHLRPGGVLVVDGWVRPDAWRDGASADVQVAEGDDMTVVRVTRSRRVGVKTTLEMHHLIATVEGIEHVVDDHELTLFTPEQYERAFSHAGLTVETVAGPVPGRDRYVGSKRA